MKEIDALIKERGMLRHPFYKAWSNGMLSMNSLRGYAKQYYFLEASFPTFLSAIHSNCSDRKARQLLVENLADEELGRENHAELWLRFCEGIGLSRKEVKSAIPLPETKKAINNFKKLSSQKNFVFGIAAMYAYESQIPEVAKTKRIGLKKFYGISGKRATKFFSVHEKADVWHSKNERKLLDKYSKNIKIRKQITNSARRARDSLWLFLDGVYKNYC